MITDENTITSFVKLMNGSVWLNKPEHREAFLGPVETILEDLAEALGCTSQRITVTPGKNKEYPYAAMKGQFADGTGIRVVFDGKKTVAQSFAYFHIGENKKRAIRFFWLVKEEW